MLHPGHIIDGPHNVRPKEAGEFFVAVGDPVPDWYPASFEFAPVDVIIHVDPNGEATMRQSLGAAEHR